MFGADARANFVRQFESRRVGLGSPFSDGFSGTCPFKITKGHHLGTRSGRVQVRRVVCPAEEWCLVCFHETLNRRVAKSAFGFVAEGIKSAG